MCPERKWKIGFNTFWWEGLNNPKMLEACIGSLVEAGYDAVEFKVDSFGPHPAKDFASGGAAQAPAYPPEEWWSPPTRPDPAAWDTLCRSLDALAKVADAEGVDLALEPVVGNLVCEFGTTMELLARCDHSRLKLTFDPSHYVLVGQDLGVAIRRFGEKIRLVHFKDAAGRAGAFGKTFIFPLLGEGSTDWPVFFDALSDIGYDGALSVEYEAFRFMALVWKGDPVPAQKLSKLAADALVKKYGSGRART
jgi:sugar phosphate isomerase/epimerase